MKLYGIFDIKSSDDLNESQFEPLIASCDSEAFRQVAVIMQQSYQYFNFSSDFVLYFISDISLPALRVSKLKKLATFDEIKSFYGRQINFTKKSENDKIDTEKESVSIEIL